MSSRLTTRTVRLLVFLLAAAGTLAAAGAGQAQQSAPAKENPVQTLYEAKKWAEALALAGPSSANPETEFFAARSLRQLGRHEEARSRYLALVARHPRHARAPDAAIEAATQLLGDLEQEARAPEERELAVQAAKELERVAERWSSNLEVRSRALYIAGNSWRMAELDGQAAAAYERVRVPGADPDYVAKSLERQGLLAERMLDPAGAKLLYDQCVRSAARSSSGRRSQKGLERVAVTGHPLSDFEVETWIQGQPLKAAELRGDVTLIFCFATWCPHCKRTLPLAADTLERYRARGFRMVGLTANTRGQTTAEAIFFVQDPQYRINYPTAVDLEERTTKALAATGLPSAVLVDRTGIIRWVGHPSYLTDGMIERLLAEPAPASAGS